MSRSEASGERRKKKEERAVHAEKEGKTEGDRQREARWKEGGKTWVII